MLRIELALKEKRRDAPIPQVFLSTPAKSYEGLADELAANEL